MKIVTVTGFMVQKLVGEVLWLFIELPLLKVKLESFFDDDSFSIICMFCVLLSTNKVTFKDVVGNPTLLQLIWFLHGLKKIYLSYWANTIYVISSTLTNSDYFTRLYRWNTSSEGRKILRMKTYWSSIDWNGCGKC